MRKLFSILLSFTSELFPYFKPSNTKGFTSGLIIIFSNLIPIFGVLFFKWNPYMIFFIYWCESLIVGFFNILKMLISGLIQDGKLSSSGFEDALWSTIHFIFTYLLLMVVYGIFIFALVMISGAGNPFSALSLFTSHNMTFIDFLESEYLAIIILLASHLIFFLIDFIFTREYNHTTADTYLKKPYKRLTVIHITICFGMPFVLDPGLNNVGFVILWVCLKIFFDLKLHVTEIKISGIQIAETSYKYR